MSQRPLLLEAWHLFANWGFGDGDMLCEHPVYLEAAIEAGVNEINPQVDHRDVLADLIERFLLPKLPSSVRTERYTTHNPVRVVDETRGRRGEFEGITIEVSRQQVVDVLREQLRANLADSGRAESSTRPHRLRVVPNAHDMGSKRSRGRRFSAPNGRGGQQRLLPIADELIIDNFAGGGGTSEGLEQAFGRPVDVAINHDPEALAMHAINHPHTLHLCESVWDVKPLAVTKGQPVALVWLSPDCKHFSKAKGGTPVEKRIRGLAWVGMRWVATTKPRVLMLENVPVSGLGPPDGGGTLVG